MRPGKKILTYVVIFLTAWLSALSYILFVFPNNFAPAGINGLCTMIQYALGIPWSTFLWHSWFTRLSAGLWPFAL